MADRNSAPKLSCSNHLHLKSIACTSLRDGKLAPENLTTTLCTTVATPNSVAQLLVDNPLFDWCRLAARPSLLRNRRNTSSSVGTFGLRPSRSA
jgi:hypothetical protein